MLLFQQTKRKTNVCLVLRPLFLGWIFYHRFIFFKKKKKNFHVTKFYEVLHVIKKKWMRKTNFLDTKSNGSLTSHVTPFFLRVIYNVTLRVLMSSLTVYVLKKKFFFSFHCVPPFSFFLPSLLPSFLLLLPPTKKRNS